MSPDTTSYLDQHPATSNDGLLTSMPMTVVVFNHGGERLELAVLEQDVALLQKLFRAGGPFDMPQPPYFGPPPR